MLSTVLVLLAAAAAIGVVVDATMRPDGIRSASAALTVAWVATAIAYRQSGRAGLAAAAALVALAQAAASTWFVAAPIAIVAWLILGLSLPNLRIVTAADESRRAIERNLHDGAQQHLVALAVKLGLARQLIQTAPEIAAGQLEELRTDVQSTITAVRELAHGIYPPLLRQQGLGEALRTAATRSPLSRNVEVDLPGRYPVEVETAVYFCCLEAIQNAGKHAGEGATITVRVNTDGPRLLFSVSDDGAGFATGTDLAASGHGFVNMLDRLGAIGGSLEVESAPGGGATISGSIPAEPLDGDADGRKNDGDK